MIITTRYSFTDHDHFFSQFIVNWNSQLMLLFILVLLYYIFLLIIQLILYIG